MFPLSHPLVLASRSPRREQILRMLGFAFEVEPSRVEEIIPPGSEPDAIAKELAGAKALEVSRRRSGLALGADTVVALDGRILEKPRDAEEALEMLRFLRGRSHAVYTGVALAREGEIQGRDVARSEVDFAHWEDSDLRDYIRTGEPMDKAGAYAAQGRGAFLVERIRGCFFNVMGLPVQNTLRLLLPYRSA